MSSSRSDGLRQRAEAFLDVDVAGRAGADAAAGRADLRVRLLGRPRGCWCRSGTSISIPSGSNLTFGMSSSSFRSRSSSVASGRRGRPPRRQVAFGRRLVGLRLDRRHVLAAQARDRRPRSCDARRSPSTPRRAPRPPRGWRGGPCPRAPSPARPAPRRSPCGLRASASSGLSAIAVRAAAAMRSASTCCSVSSRIWTSSSAWANESSSIRSTSSSVRP